MGTLLVMPKISEIFSSYHIALDHFERGDYKKAARILRNYVSNNMTDPDGWELYSYCMMELARNYRERCESCKNNEFVKHFTTALNYLEAAFKSFELALFYRSEQSRIERSLRKDELTLRQDALINPPTDLTSISEEFPD